MNMIFSFTKTKIPDLTIITPFFAEDHRGFFLKNFESNIFKENGIDFVVTECFESGSYQNTLRGLHFQRKNPQSKLVRAITGEIWDVAVDLRKDSPTYKQWYGQVLSKDNRKMLYIPPGFAHGFFVLSEYALVSYQCAGVYDKETDGGVLWSDTDINVTWPIPIGASPIISERDLDLLPLAAL